MSDRENGDAAMDSRLRGNDGGHPTEARKHGEQRREFGLLAAIVVASPVLVGVGYSVLGALGVAGPGADGLGMRHVQSVVADGATWRGLLWSLWIASASTAIAAVLAMAVATVFRGGRVSDRLVRFMALGPLPVPHVVAALCGLLIFSQSGLLSRIAFATGLHSSPADMPALTNDRYGIGLILTLVWKEFAFLALVAFSVIARRGAALEETARSLGAGALQSFRVAVLPALWRGLLPSIVAVFTFVAGNYEAAVLLAPSSPLALPLLTMERFTDSALGVRGEAFVLVLLAMVVSIAGVAAHEWAAGRAEAGD